MKQREKATENSAKDWKPHVVNNTYCFKTINVLKSKLIIRRQMNSLMCH